MRILLGRCPSLAARALGATLVIAGQTNATAQQTKPTASEVPGRGERIEQPSDEHFTAKNEDEEAERSAARRASGGPSQRAEPSPDLSSPARPALPPDVEAELEQIHGRRVDLQRGAMVTLGTWALGNLAVGLWGDLVREDDGGSARYFYQMSWMWGAVNGVIAGFGLFQTFNDDSAKHGGYRASLDRARTTEVIYLVNGALDLGYLGAGAWLWERGLRTEDRVLEGYGQAIVLQGAFLLLFDGALFLLSRTITSDLEQLPVELIPVPVALLDQTAHPAGLPTVGGGLIGRF